MGSAACLGRGQRGGQHPPRQRRVDLHEGRTGPWLTCAAAVAAVVEELGDLRRHPAVASHAAAVVVDDDDERVLLLARVAEHADHLVPVPVGVGVDVALGGLDGAHMLGPGRAGHALVHQRECRLLRLSTACREVPRQAIPDSSASAAGLPCRAA